MHELKNTIIHVHFALSYLIEAVQSVRLMQWIEGNIYFS